MSDNDSSLENWLYSYDLKRTQSDISDRAERQHYQDNQGFDQQQNLQQPLKPHIADD